MLPLAELIGVNQRTIRRWAHGDSAISDVSAAVIEAVCRRLKVPVPLTREGESSRKNVNGGLPPKYFLNKLTNSVPKP